MRLPLFRSPNSLEQSQVKIIRLEEVIGILQTAILIYNEERD